MQTIRLFDYDQYLTEFNAEVLEVEGLKVVLDKTAFYPESGGQVGDTGTLNEWSVLDTRIIDGKQAHILEKEPNFEVGEYVHGKIDWDRRYKIMKIHSASHVMEHIFFKNFGVLKRLGSRVDDKKDRSDYKSDTRLDSKLLKDTEVEVNAFLSEGHDVRIKVDEVGIRTWISGPYIDHCGGTHVKNTSEIGMIKLKRKNPGRGKERVETSLK
jgi:Ser-tRNA(Ala) deacylase AlaX